VSESAASILSAGAMETVRAVLVEPGRRVEPVLLSGEDGKRFAQIKLLLGARSITAIVIPDHDGPAAMAWIDEFGDRKGLAPNEILSALVDRTLPGPTVITGFGLGDRYSMSSVHPGLQQVLERMAQEAGATS
jgi:hypothetical protein